MTAPTIRPIEMTARSGGLLWAGLKTQTRRLPTSPLAKANLGDYLYVREPFHARRDFTKTPPRDIPNSGLIHAADWSALDTPAAREYGRCRPARFMPRRFSRQTLQITGAHIEPLQSLTETDAKAEGCDPASYTTKRPHICAYRDWWDRLHPQTPWTSNPDVLVLTFTVLRTNIDTHLAAQTRRAG